MKILLLSQVLPCLTPSSCPVFKITDIQCFNRKLTQLLGSQGESKHTHSLVGLVLNCNTLSSAFMWLSSPGSFLRIYALDDLSDKNDTPNTLNLCKAFSHSLAN